MYSTVNSVCTIEKVDRNTLILEVIPNNLRDGGLQFYYLGGNKKSIDFINFREFDNKMKNLVKSSNTIYLTFCGISRNDNNVPEYLYLVFNGNDISYRGKEDGRLVYLELKLNKEGCTLEEELDNLFRNNIGVFVQGYLN